MFDAQRIVYRYEDTIYPARSSFSKIREAHVITCRGGDLGLIQNPARLHFFYLFSAFGFPPRHACGTSSLTFKLSLGGKIAFDRISDRFLEYIRGDVLS